MRSRLTLKMQVSAYPLGWNVRARGIRIRLSIQGVVFGFLCRMPSATMLEHFLTYVLRHNNPLLIEISSHGIDRGLIDFPSLGMDYT